MADATYELIRVDVFPLQADGQDQVGGDWIQMEVPKELAVDPTVLEGEEVQERGGGKLAINIKEPPVVTGGEISFQNLEIDPEAFECMCGGTIEMDGLTVIGYSDPGKDDTPPLFKMRAYAERYVDDALTGYRELTFPKCKATPPSYTIGQQSVAVPELKISCEHNAKATNPSAPPATISLPWRKVINVTEMEGS